MLIGVPFFHRALQKLVFCRLNHTLKPQKPAPMREGRLRVPPFDGFAFGCIHFVILVYNDSSVFLIKFPAAGSAKASVGNNTGAAFLAEIYLRVDLIGGG